MFHRNVAEKIHLIEHANVNLYLVEDGDQIMLVDSGLPAMWKMTVAALRELGRSPRDIFALRTSTTSGSRPGSSTTSMCRSTRTRETAISPSTRTGTSMKRTG
jgi:hypothetical protein